MIFSDGDARTRRWWRRLLKRGFRHCWVMTETVDDFIVELEVLASGIELRAGQGWPHHRLTDVVAKGCRVLTLTRDWRPYLGRVALQPNGAILTCASVIGLYLGISRRCLTPWSLWQHLLRAGAKEISHGGHVRWRRRSGIGGPESG